MLGRSQLLGFHSTNVFRLGVVVDLDIPPDDGSLGPAGALHEVVQNMSLAGNSLAEVGMTDDIRFLKVVGHRTGLNFVNEEDVARFQDKVVNRVRRS